MQTRLTPERDVFHTRIFANFSAFRVDFCVSKIPLNISAGHELTIARQRHLKYCRAISAYYGRSAPLTVR
jgi:hypothetical protein